MKFLLSFLLLAGFAYAEPQDKPTFKSDQSQIGKYFTGYKRRPLTQEEFQATNEFSQQAVTEGWTFETDARGISAFKDRIGGLKPGSFKGLPVIKLAADSDKFKSASLNDFGMPRAPIYDQGQCGSCVPTAFTAGAMDLMLQRGVNVPVLSAGAAMWCSNGDQCSGYWGEEMLNDMIRLGSLPSNADLPYVPQNGRCPDLSKFKRYGSFDGGSTIDGSAKSILAAIHGQMPVMCGIAADNIFSSYRSGVYNPQSFSMATNHYLKVTGINCEDAVDADGNCAFDSKGNLPPGKGIIEIDNEWGTGYGDGGRIYMRLTNKAGKRTNNICGGSGNAQVLTTKIPLPPKGPVTFKIESNQATWEVTLDGVKYSTDEARTVLQRALNSAGK